MADDGSCLVKDKDGQCTLFESQVQALNLWQTLGRQGSVQSVWIE